ncbi:hypothetical protein [Picosynechococcus sp. NKBG15041c]|nr:hypothetical protein [Picosynechococcus sp. NKBG15041c]
MVDAVSVPMELGSRTLWLSEARRRVVHHCLHLFGLINGSLPTESWLRL